MFSLCEYETGPLDKPELGAELDADFYAGQKPPALRPLLNEDGGNPRDLANSASNLTFNGGVTWAPSIGGVSPKIDGSTGYIAIADATGTQCPPQLRFTGAFSVWIDFVLNATGTYSGIGRWQSLGGAAHVCYYISPFGTSLFGGISDGVTVNTISVSSVLAAGIRYQAALTWDGTTGIGGLKLCLNAQLIKTGAASIASIQDPANRRAWIGGTADQSDGLLSTNGSFIGALAVNYPLSLQQIARLSTDPYADAQQSVMGRFFGAGSSFQPAWASGANVLIGGGLAA